MRTTSRSTIRSWSRSTAPVMRSPCAIAAARRLPRTFVTPCFTIGGCSRTFCRTARHSPRRAGNQGLSTEKGGGGGLLDLRPSAHAEPNRTSTSRRRATPALGFGRPGGTYVRASEAEFRYRFWIIFALFWLGFGSYTFDRQNLAANLVHAFAPGLDLDSHAAVRALQAVFGLAAFLGVIAAALRSWASSYLRSDVVHDTALRTEGLVADGPFRHVRNPLYLGNIILSLGMALLMSPLGALILVVGQTFFLLRLVGREEAELLASEGDRFRAYCAAVPKLVPSLVPRVPAGSARPHVVEGLVGESFSWILALAMVVFALTLNSRIIPVFVGAGFAVYWLLFVVWKKRGRGGADVAGAKG